MNFSPQLLNTLRQRLRVTVLTGAGVSKESGIPTFREAQTGLWAQYDPTELATPQAFRRSPRLVWEWYTWRRGLVNAVSPNAGHFALAQMAAKFPHFTLITQNVDGLHQRAGSPQVIELHGNILRTKCSEQGEVIETWADGEETPPRCPNCGGLLRPDVVWFGENLPAEAIEQAMHAAQNAQVFFSIGTSAMVEPAASLPHFARQAGAVVVEINPDTTPLTPYADYVLQGASGEVLPALMQALFPQEETP